jgi:hypothetical protein
MAEQLLKHLGRNPALNGPGRIGVPKSMYTEYADPSCVTQLIKMCVIGAVLVRFSGAVIHEYQVFHDQISFLPAHSISILQYL